MRSEVVGASGVARGAGGQAAFWALALVGLGGGLGGCDSDSVDPLADKARAIVTYNVGLATGFVDYAAERRPKLVELIAGLDADLVCLQEVWSEDDVRAIADGVKAAFPYSHHVMTRDTSIGPPACTTAESDPLLACMDTNCPGVPAGEVASCALDHCRAEFGALNAICVNCIVANIGKEVSEIIDLCKSGSPKYAYEGSNGLLLLSRAKMSAKGHMNLDSTNVQRSVLAAAVSLPGLGVVDVACTHLSSDLTSIGVGYTGPSGSWAGENKAQAEAVWAFASGFGDAAALTVVLGDMNSGPAYEPDVKAEIPEAAFKVFNDAGLVDFPASLAPDASGRVCTYCEENLLTADTEKSVQIDHIYLTKVPTGYTPKVTRVGTEPITITSQGGEAVSTHPSDHFGVRLELSR